MTEYRDGSADGLRVSLLLPARVARRRV